jgi:hypothetical protein
MSKLRLYCRRCQKEVPSAAADPSGLCVICITSDDVATDKVEYQRQWAKRARYLAKGVNVAPVQKQCAKLATRLGNKVHARISNPKLAISIINAHLEEARNVVERGQPHPRIMLPKPGDFTQRWSA